MKNIFNIIGFQIGWWTCVLGAAKNLPYWGPVVMLLFLAFHFYFFSRDLKELKLVLFFAIGGTIIDTGIAYSGLIVYNGPYSFEYLIAPMWITAMWCGFVATINHSMAWLNNKWSFAFLLGAIFGPLSYVTANKFGAVQFSSSIFTTLLILGLIWGASMPAIYWINAKIRFT